MKALIVAGGEKPGKNFLRTEAVSASIVIAADRGAGYCLDAEVVPDLVVGDMDSLSREFQTGLASKGVEVLRFDRKKDMTDTQIALDTAMDKGADEIRIIAGTGSRFDHSLANVHLLFRALKRGADARIVSRTQEIFLIEKSCMIRNEAGSTVSFLPLGLHADGITLRGFEYEIEDACMEVSFPIGVSNVIRSDKAEVIVRGGILTAVIVRKVE